MTEQLQERVSIEERVREYYWKDDLNCAITNLKILSEIFSLRLSEQVISAAIGMHGAGKYGAQCGLVEGTLMFLGIIGKEYNIREETVVAQCREYAQQFEDTFKSLSCSVLRPEGFNKENPEHLCEKLTCAAIEFNKDFVALCIRGN
ncbi:MAG: C-GCAxxG-C-C family protein [Desulfopila sp.]|jgi:C_GCAxxG_C_C family probable redox protein|nr:C-GCAxxG-C-C family protein [Desulfopila sp.]